MIGRFLVSDRWLVQKEIKRIKATIHATPREAVVVIVAAHCNISGEEQLPENRLSVDCRPTVGTIVCRPTDGLQSADC